MLCNNVCMYVCMCMPRWTFKPSPFSYQSIICQNNCVRIIINIEWLDDATLVPLAKRIKLIHILYIFILLIFSTKDLTATCCCVGLKGRKKENLCCTNIPCCDERHFDLTYEMTWQTGRQNDWLTDWLSFLEDGRVCRFYCNIAILFPELMLVYVELIGTHTIKYLKVYNNTFGLIE